MQSLLVPAIPALNLWVVEVTTETNELKRTELLDFHLLLSAVGDCE